MIDRKTGTAIALLLAATLAGIGRADATDALTNYADTDPAAGKTGTAHATATAVIAQNMVIEYVTPMNLDLSVQPGDYENRHRVAAGKAGERASGRRGAPPQSASLAVQGMPNQVFAVSIYQPRPGADAPDGSGITAFTHDAGQTPHIGSAGGTEFTIGATLRLARNTTRRGYSGALDVIVSHN